MVEAVEFCNALLHRGAVAVGDGAEGALHLQGLEGLRLVVVFLRRGLEARGAFLLGGGDLVYRGTTDVGRGLVHGAEGAVCASTDGLATGGILGSRLADLGRQ